MSQIIPNEMILCGTCRELMSFIMFLFYSILVVSI